MEYDDMKEIVKWMDDTSKSESEINDEVADMWKLIPENVLINIFKYSKVKDILSSSAACKRWNFIANDEMLWKWKFQQDFKIDKRIQRKPGEKENQQHILCFLDMPI